MTTTVNEVPRLHTWIRTVLTADGTLNAAVGGRIYRGRMPQNAAYPAVIYALLSAGDDVRGSGPTRIWWKPLYKVVAVGEGNNLLSLQTIADRIDVVLHGVVGGSSSGIAVDYCIRKRPFYLDEVEPPNKVFQQLGGEFEFGVRAA
jgi:hypothetical protein